MVEFLDLITQNHGASRMKSCRLCGNSKITEYYKIDEGCVLFSCTACGFKQIPTPPTDQLDGVASEQSILQDLERKTSSEDMKINQTLGLTGPMSKLAHILQQDSIRVNNTIKQLIDETFFSSQGISLIDIGSGYGQHSFSLKKQFPNLDVHLLEISKKRMQTGIETFNPDLNNFTFHHRILNDDFSEEYFEKFDISFSFHVLEHVYDIKTFIKNVFNITKNGGIIVLEVPNEDDDLSLISNNYRKIIHFPAHVSCFTKDTLSKLVEESGIAEKVEIKFIPVQRYGFFNYIDWVRHNEKNKVISDDYIPRKETSWIEKKWLETKSNNFTTDSIMMVLRKK